MVGRPSQARGLIFGVLAAVAFGTSGAFLKPLLESGWSPAAAVTFRAGIAALVLLPIALVSLRGRWDSVWRARWRILGMGLVGVAGTQLAYFAALQRIPVSTALLIEYLAPLILVGVVWVSTRRAPKAVVIIGSVAAIGGLALVIGPGSLGSADGLGILFAFIGAIGCAGYYVIAARPSQGLPPVAFAAAGLLLGALSLAVVGAVGLVPFTLDFDAVVLFETPVAWWVPLLVVGVIGTGFAYAASITASEILGSRLISFVGLLEVVFASLFAWVLIGEALTPLQLLGGVAILAGIALVRSDKSADVPLEPGAVDEEALAATDSIAVIGVDIPADHDEAALGHRDIPADHDALPTNSSEARTPARPAP